MKKKIQFLGLNGTENLPPENTLESVQRALEARIGSIDVDVHCCDSGELVVIHDSDVDVTTNGMGEVEDFTLDELKKLRIDGTYQIPSLEEVLDLIDGQAKVNIELRGFGISEAVVQIIKKYSRKDNWKRKMFLVTSFNWFELFDFYAIDQKIRIGVLTQKLNKDSLTMAKNIKAYSIHPKEGDTKEKHLGKALKRGLKVIPWLPKEGAALPIDDEMEGEFDDDVFEMELPTTSIDPIVDFPEVSSGL